jgi:hypothetical protein
MSSSSCSISSLYSCCNLHVGLATPLRPWDPASSRWFPVRWARSPWEREPRSRAGSTRCRRCRSMTPSDLPITTTIDYRIVIIYITRDTWAWLKWIDASDTGFVAARLVRGSSRFIVHCLYACMFGMLWECFIGCVAEWSLLFIYRLWRSFGGAFACFPFLLFWYMFCAWDPARWLIFVLPLFPPCELCASCVSPKLSLSVRSGPLRRRWNSICGSNRVLIAVGCPDGKAWHCLWYFCSFIFT